jgi:hypothetical protein
MDGALRATCAIFAVLLASFLLDWLLDLPLGVRAVVLAAAVLVVGATVFRRIVRPLALPLGDEQLALAIEARRPELRDGLISALQFARQMEDPENEESVPLMLAVLDDAADAARGGRLAESVPARGLGVPALVLLTLAVTSIVIAATSPQVVGIWANRAVLGSTPWPRATELVVLDLDPDEPVVLTRGDDLSVVVEARGKVPDEVWIRSSPLEGDGGVERRRMGRLGEEDGRFEFTFRQIPRSFTFVVRGGDDDDDLPVYTIRALVPPAVESIEARCAYPAFTGREPETITTGDFEVPEGTTVDLAVRANMEVRSATISREGGPPVELVRADDGTLATRFTVEGSFEYTIALVGPEGQRNRLERDTYRVTSVPDRRPEVRLLSPTSRDVFAPNALLPLKVLATDNYGVDAVQVVWRIGLAGEENTLPLDTSGERDRREVVAFDPIELTSLRLPDGRAAEPGDLVLLEVAARDNNGMEDRTDDPIRIEVARPDDVERRLGQRQVGLREEASGARSIQEEARGALEVLLGDVRPEDPLDRAAVDRLRDVQILQGRITRKMDEFLSGIERVLNGYVFNRLGNEVAGEAMLAIYLRHLERDREDLSRVFKRELYADIVAAYRRGEIFDPEVLGILVQIHEVGTAIAEDLSPRAHGIVSELVRGDGAVAGRLQAVAEVQAAALAEFDKLMTMMKRWETYHEFILRLQELEEDQRSITDRARRSQQEPGREENR